jgi:hypothetical protein
MERMSDKERPIDIREVRINFFWFFICEDWIIFGVLLRMMVSPYFRGGTASDGRLVSVQWRQVFAERPL